MRPLKEYDISFTGLKPGDYQFDYLIDKKFFEAFDYDDYLDSNVDIKLDFVRKTNLLELHLKAAGTVNVLCDVSAEPYDQPIKGDLDVVIKFGEEFNDDEADLVIIPFGESQINVAQFIYELIVLATPVKRVHPGIEAGTLNSEVLDKLNELSPGHHKSEEETDPRWDALKKLINK